MRFTVGCGFTPHRFRCTKFTELAGLRPRRPLYCRLGFSPYPEVQKQYYIVCGNLSTRNFPLCSTALAFSCTLPKVACFQSFLLTHCDFCGDLSQQFNITYLLRVSARLLKEPEQVFNFLSLHNEPEPRPSRKGWSGLGCCVAFFYCQIQHRTLTTERPSAWDTRR